MGLDRARTLRGALAGAVAAGVWAAQQPLDKRAFRSSYDDLELLGRAVRPGDDGWLPAGVALHVQNGALFGAAYAHVAPLMPVPAAARGVLAALTEHFATWPLTRLTDRMHPAREQLPRLAGNRRALWQATWRHLLFGIVLGELERRLNAEPEIELPDYQEVVSHNGHGRLEHAAAAAPPAS